MVEISILITGTDGFIGESLKDYLINEGFNIFGTVYMREPEENEIKIDFSKEAEFKKLPDRDFEIIIHTVGIVDQTLPKKLMFEVNAEGTRRILDWAKSHGCKHFIQMSSTSVYGMKVIGENRREDNTKRYHGRFAIPYGRSKAKAEKYIEKSGIAYTILRMPPVIGKNDSFVSEVIIPRLLNGNFYFSGKKDKKFSFLYIKNLNSIISKLIETGPQNDVFNASDYSLFWRDFIEEFAENLNVKVKDQRKSFLSGLIHWKDKQYLFMIGYSYYGGHFPNDKLKKAIDWEPEYSWKVGVKEAIDGYFEKIQEV
jgi:nucleoside-diphosphate-sugar epimerase